MDREPEDFPLSFGQEEGRTPFVREFCLFVLLLLSDTVHLLVRFTLRVRLTLVEATLTGSFRNVCSPH